MIEHKEIEDLLYLLQVYSILNEFRVYFHIFLKFRKFVKKHLDQVHNDLNLRPPN
jgi:hypothetical protein